MKKPLANFELRIFQIEIKYNQRLLLYIIRKFLQVHEKG